MKRIIIILIFLLIFSVPAKADENVYTDQLNAIGMEEITKIPNKETRQILNDLGATPYDTEWVEKAPGNIFSLLKDIFVNGFSGLKTIFLSVISVLILWAVFNTLSQNDGVNTAFTIILTLIITVPVLSDISASGSAIKGSGVFMLSFIPAFCGIVASGGNVATAMQSGGMLLVAAEFTVQILAFIVVPLGLVQLALYLSGVLSNVSPGVRLAAAIKKGANYILTFTFTVFLGLLSVSSAIGSAADTVGIKTVKFMVGSFVPVAGTALSEVVSTLGSSVKLLQSGVGIYAVFVIAATTLPVILKLTLWRIVLNGADIAAQIMFKEPPPAALKAVDSVVSLIIGVMLFTAALFIISLAVLMKAGAA